MLSDREMTPDAERTLSRQPSTTEYLPGMLTMSAPPGLLPYYSSWSLVCLGASSLYSHNVGLSEGIYPGFLSGTNYLLPWDVTVCSKAKNAWPQVSYLVLYIVFLCLFSNDIVDLMHKGL